MMAGYPRSSRLAAASLGTGTASLLGHLVPWGAATQLSGNLTPSHPLALPLGLCFWLAVLMIPVALVLGIVAKVRRGQPGWWSTLGMVLAGTSAAMLLVDAFMVLAVLSGQG